ncbi:hypothetical protein [Pseudooceanicola aestuarii]|uniref:hypothetical protein n=1 Tax=Pseudooceanicola aestuarii TaxID=2697319 RepID=UPI0013CF71A8|nr:hypothetical protein [Pseudooceanicola aestuarii]
MRQNPASSLCRKEISPEAPLANGMNFALRPYCNLRSIQRARIKNSKKFVAAGNMERFRHLRIFGMSTLTIRLFRCEACGHRMRMRGDLCGRCHAYKEWYQKPWPWVALAICAPLLVTATLAAAL